MLDVMNNSYEYDIDLFVFGNGELCPKIPEGVKVIYGKRYLSLISTKEQIYMFPILLMRIKNSLDSYRSDSEWFRQKILPQNL